MFHLLISFRGWPDGGGDIENNRIYLDPNTAPDSSFFYTNGSLDIRKVGQIPALLVFEPNMPSSKPARVGYITGMTRGPKDTRLEYIIDDTINPIPNSELKKYESELRPKPWGLSHTCWEIYDKDLFKLLLRLEQSRTHLRPKEFKLDSAYTPDSRLVSVMMPFAEEISPVREALKQAAEAVGMQCQRADDIWDEAVIIQDVINLIGKARIVICDCTGKNPNVFYEAGIADAIGKDVILIAQSSDDIPFNLRHLRHIRYLPNNEGYRQLKDQVRERIETLIRR